MDGPQDRASHTLSLHPTCCLNVALAYLGTVPFVDENL